MWNGGHGDRFWGASDEVRIFDSALALSEFLFAPEPATMVLMGLGALSLIFIILFCKLISDNADFLTWR
jgi:hypothetical protein